MNHRHFPRVVSMTLTLVLVLGILSPIASATDDYREFRPELPIPEGPQWTEEEITCQSGENTLRGTMTVPDNVEGTMPVAVLLHGLNTDRRWCDDIAWILADHGIASVRFDFSGNGVSDGAQEDMTVSSLTLDTRAILDYVQNLAITDQENIFVVGKSMGAIAALMASKSMGDSIKAMCFWYPAFNLKSIAQHGRFLDKRINPLFPPETIEIWGYTYGREFITELQIMDYESACQEYSGSVMIIHGTHDPVVPIEFSFATQHLFQDCTMNVVPGGFHGFFGFQEVLALNDMLDFFQAQME